MAEMKDRAAFSIPTAPASAEKVDKPHYHGHRARLREKFLKHGGGALADYELLELLLASAIPRRDVKPLAKQLLKRFDSFTGVITADPSSLLEEKGLGEAAVVALKAVQAAAQRMLLGEVKGRTFLDSWDKLLDYCYAIMAHEKTEQFRLLFLDTKNRLVADEVQGQGTINHTPVYPREVARRAIELGASAMIIAHNHPSGDPTPSSDDVEITRQVRDALKAIGVILHDHVIIGREGYTSLRAQGLI